MATENRPNYFLLLGIDPDAPWNEAAFEPRLRDKRGDWSRKALNGVKTSKAVMAAQRALELVNDIRLVMLDQDRRDQERDAARAQLARDHAARHADFELDLDIMLAKGFLYETEDAKLRRDYANLVGTADVAERLARVPVRPMTDDDSPLPERLDPSKAGTIRGLLDSLGERSLYTLLRQVNRDIDMSIDLDTLQRAARTLYQQTQMQTDKTKPGLAARQELAGHAMAVFKTPKDRERYDNTLALAHVDDLIRRYQSVLAPVRRIEGTQVERFVHEATKAGADAVVARTMLVKHFSDQKWTVVVPATVDDGAPGSLVRCGVCQTPHEPDDKVCKQCGARFRATCPSCGKVGPGHGLCGQCGFPVGDQDWVEVLLRDCEDQLRLQDLARAGETLATISRAWPLPANSPDKLAVRYRRFTERYKQMRQERAEADREVSRRLLALVESRQFFAAHRSAAAAAPTVADRDRVLRESEDRIRAADRQYELAQRPGISVQEKAVCYERALAECADHEKSQQALRLLSPEPPRDLRVVVADNVVSLRWQPSSTRDVRYAIVRKRGTTPPASAVDGLRIATVPALHYDDVAPEIGVPMHYAVFADRAGTVSEQCAATTDTLFLTAEVTVTSRSVEDGAVVLEWTLPVHALGIIAQRSADKTETVATEPNRLRDQGLRNDVNYTYTLRARYQDAQGAVVLSKGVSVSLTPGAPPVPPRAVHVRTVGQPNLGFSYRHADLLLESAERGTPKVLWSRQQPSIRAGDRVDEVELPRHGSLLAKAEAHGCALFDSGLYYFTSVVIHHGLGYVGGVRRYAAVDEVGDLTAVNQGNGIRLQWTWPEGCDAVLVAYDHADWAADPTVARHQLTVDRADYERAGWYDVPASGQEEEREFFFMVAAVVRNSDEVFVSSGIRARARVRPRVRMEYEIVGTRRHNRINIRVSAPVQLPGLVIVGRADKPPENRDDGRLLSEHDALPARRTHTITLPVQGEPLFAKLFLRGGGDDVDVDVVPPATEAGLRLR